MKDCPLVSVLMTSYNREQYIAAAIESVLASTYTNLELIICDDRSSDRTVEIAQSYVAKDSRVKIYINEVNLGDYPNRNKAASYANGKYLKYQDSDDLIYPHSLEIMVSEIEKYPEVSFAFMGNEVQDNKSSYPVLYSSAEAYRTHFFSIGQLFYAGPGGTIIRKSAFEKIGPFSGKRLISDMEMWMKFALYTPVLKIQPGLIWWRVHEGQEFSVGQRDYALLRYAVNKEMLEHPNCPLTNEERRAALGNNRRLMGRRILIAIFKELKISSGISMAQKAGIGPLVLFESMIPVNRLKKKIQAFNPA